MSKTIRSRYAWLTKPRDGRWQEKRYAHEVRSRCGYKQRRKDACLRPKPGPSINDYD